MRSPAAPAMSRVISTHGLAATSAAVQRDAQVVIRRCVDVVDEDRGLGTAIGRGRIEDIFSRLVSIPSLLCLPRFELEIVLTHQDELRVHRPGKAFRRRG